MTFVLGRRFGNLFDFYIFPRRHFYVLGIESSCDDTSAAVVDDSGNVLGEGHFSQSKIHLEAGGIIPSLASSLHRQHLKSVVYSSIKRSMLSFKDFSAIAVTVKPGLILSLEAGVEYAKDLCTLYSRPMIPIHHMEAHALTGRLVDDVKFPFLTFLMSGGHCILALVKSVDEFYTLGSGDDSPGSVLDKIARRARLKNLAKFRGLVGGKAVETAAEGGDPFVFNFPKSIMLTQGKNCNFSFSGFLRNANYYIEKEEKEKKVAPDEVIPNVNDLCAGVLFSMAVHMCQRLEVAFHYVETKELLKRDEKCLDHEDCSGDYLVLSRDLPKVASGGVACNKFFQKALKKVCNEYGYKLVVPPDELCSDNGVMIAWNGVERLKMGLPTVEPNNLSSVTYQAQCPLGKNISDDVKEEGRKMRFTYVKLKDLMRKADAKNEESKTAGEV